MTVDILNPIEYQVPVPAGAREDARGEVVLAANGLKKSFGGQVVLDGVDLRLRRGEVALLRGANGSGKTTLLNVLTGNVKPESGTMHVALDTPSREFAFPEPWWRPLRPVLHFSPETLASHGVGRTWQDGRLFPTQILRDNIAVAATGQLGERLPWPVVRPAAVRRSERGLLTQADAVLLRLGLDRCGRSRADAVSLGQSKRVAIARAVQAGASLLYLDEPFAGLDSPGIKGVVSLLRELIRDAGLTVVMVEHPYNISRVMDLASTVWTLEDGKLHVEEQGTIMDTLREAPGDSIHTMVAQIGNLQSIGEETLGGGAVFSRFGRTGSSGDVVFESVNLLVHRGRRLVVGEADTAGAQRGISFCLRRGEVAFLQAPNGWGKTTLLDALAGLMPSSGGHVIVGGKNVSRWPAWRRRRCGLSFLQSRDHAFPQLTVGDTLRLIGIHELPAGAGFPLSRRMSELSGGEKQSIALLTALQHPNVSVALLDEPFSALDGDAFCRAGALLANSLKQSAVLVAVPGRA